MTTSSKVNNFNRNHSTVHDDQSNTKNDDGPTHFNDEHSSEDENHHKIDNPQQLNGIKLNEIVDQENQNLLTVRSCKSISTSVKHVRTTCTSTFLQCLCPQHIHKAVIITLCLQLSLTVSVQYSTPSLQRHLHSCTCTVFSTSISKE